LLLGVDPGCERKVARAELERLTAWYFDIGACAIEFTAFEHHAVIDRMILIARMIAAISL
jgi:hypothetical protein